MQGFRSKHSIYILTYKHKLNPRHLESIKITVRSSKKTFLVSFTYSETSSKFLFKAGTCFLQLYANQALVFLCWQLQEALQYITTMLLRKTFRIIKEISLPIWNYFEVRSTYYFKTRLNDLWNYFMQLASFYAPWKHQKIRGFLMFSGGIERDHWHKMG